MSESQTQSYKPAQTATKNVSPVLVWALVLVIAAGAFVGAYFWAGGLDGVKGMLGLSSAGTTSPKSTASATTSATPSAVASLPADAQAKMYSEQLESQQYILALANGEMTSMSLGAPSVKGDTAEIPVTVTSADGATVKGGLTLRQYNGTWYFQSIHSLGKADAVQSSPAAFDATVVKVITDQQGQAATQELIKNGLLGGGYKKLAVDGVVNGSGTKTVNVSMTGGSEAPESGRFVLIEKNDGATTYWFIARFEKQ